MKRSAVGLAEIADLHNLAAAFHAAARGKRGRGDVEAFRGNLDRELSALHAVPGFPKSIDPTTVDDYLMYGCIPSPKTIFKGRSGERYLMQLPIRLVNSRTISVR